MARSTRYIAFLRAINVGGHTVKMDRLRELFSGLGLASVATFIASGNVIFESAAKRVEALTPKIERALHAELGYEVATFLRTFEEVGAIAAYEPFSHAEIEAAPGLNVGFLERALTREERKRLSDLESAVDKFHVAGREVYWLCRVRQSESKFTNAAFERALGVRATFRGIKTVRRLAAKYPPRVG